MREMLVQIPCARKLFHNVRHEAETDVEMVLGSLCRATCQARQTKRPWSTPQYVFTGQGLDVVSPTLLRLNLMGKVPC